MKLFGRAPGAATADRGYGEAAVDKELHALGVKTVVIPRKGRVNAERRKLQTSKGFVSSSSGAPDPKGRISHFKHSWCWNRTLIDGIDGARTWCGWRVLAHNATKIAALVEAREPERDRRQPPSPSARGPCRPPPPPSKSPAA